MLKIGVFGCGGRMGKAVLSELYSNSSIIVTGGTVSENSKFIGQDLGKIACLDNKNIYAHTFPEEIIEKSDAIIDFTTPNSVVNHVQLAAESGKAIVIGTTGLSEDQLEFIRKMSAKCPIVLSPNMSLGMTVMRSIIQKAAEMLDISFDIEVFERHHREKVDAPSGTSLCLIKALSKARNQKFGFTENRKDKRKQGDIGVSVSRGGTSIGDHVVSFCGDGEVIEIKHSVSNRKVFANGSVKAAIWLIKNRRPGLYKMEEVLLV
jgi:4-hydroxy-tetrahydrodipicolinate reductase